MPRSRTPARIRDQIDDNLRRIFDEDAEQDLPPRLRALLDQLEERERAPGDQSGAQKSGGGGGHLPGRRAGGSMEAAQ